MNRLLTFTLVLQIAILGTLVVFKNEIFPQPANAIELKDSTPPNPNRPYFDEFGNQYAYDGRLIHVACPSKPDPVTGKTNPYCVVPPAITNVGGK